MCVCELTLSNGVFNDLNGLVELSNLNLDRVGPHLGLLGRGQRSDCKQLKIKGSHAEEFIIIRGSKWKSGLRKKVLTAPPVNLYELI